VNLDNEMHDDDSGEREREISLGTSTILGIFFALALVCAAFFGFGYSLGRHASQATAPPPVAKSDESADTSAGSPFDHFKSAPAKAPQPDTSTSDAADTTQDPPRVVVAPNAAKTPPPAHNVAFPVPSTAAAAPTTAPTVASGQFVVQVSAPSHQGDADNLVAMLKRKGYTAYIRKEPQDSLLHVQIGPFATHKDAEAMRVRVAADTPYKPFIK
jgi:DedD protein